MKKAKLTLMGLLMGMVISTGGCVVIEPVEESVVPTETSAPEDESNALAKETKETEEESKETETSKETEADELVFSDEYLVGFGFGGSSWGTYYDCVDVNVIICTNRDVLVQAPSIETTKTDETGIQLLAKLTLSEEQYANITKALDREKLYNMKIKSNRDVCDGSSYSLILYDQDENVAKVCGAYEPTTKAFNEMYKAVMDNIPKNELSAIRSQYVNELEHYDESDIVMKAPAQNGYQAFYDFLTKAFDGKIVGSEGKNGVSKVNAKKNLTTDLTQWKSFGLLDVNEDKVDEFIISNRELMQDENDDTVYMIVTWIDDMIYAVEVSPKQMPNVDFTSINYQDQGVMSVILQAEASNIIEGVTKEEKTFYYVVTMLTWLHDTCTDQTKEEIEARMDCEIVSDLGERTDFRRTNAEGKDILYQYRMKELDVRLFYECVMDLPRDFEPGFDSSSVHGVYCDKDGYLYSHNEAPVSDYVSIDEVEKPGFEVIIRGTAWDGNNNKKLAYITVSLVEDSNDFGCKIAKYCIEKVEE